MTLRMTVGVALVSLLAGCATPAVQKGSPSLISIDVEQNPDLRFRIDTFSVPAEARAPFVAAMQRNYAFIKTLPGFKGHLVVEQTGGPSVFNIATLAVWENQSAVDKAVVEVRAYYQRIGFEPAALAKQYGIRAEMGFYAGLPGSPTPGMSTEH